MVAKRRKKNKRNCFLGCRALDDQALYDIAAYLGENLDVIELDHLPNVAEPCISIEQFSQRCSNLSHLSLCRFFEVSWRQIFCFVLCNVRSRLLA